MRGLQIKPNWKPAIPKEQRSFAAFFQPIFPQLAPLHWVYPDTIPFCGDDAEFEALVEGRCSEGHIPPVTLLPKFARFVIEDWAAIYGFQNHPDFACARRQVRDNPRDYEWVSQNADVCFFNVDGAWWEIYAKNQNLIEAVRRHVSGTPNIKIWEGVLTERDILT